MTDATPGDANAGAAAEGPSASALLAQLRREHAGLSPMLAAAASYLLERPDEIAFTSMRQMASRAGVQPAIMVRLAQRLGLDGYEALREPFRVALQRRAAGLGQRARDLQARVNRHGGGHPVARLASERIALERENLENTLRAAGGERLGEVAQQLAGSRRLCVAGDGSLYAAAYLFARTTALFRPNVLLLDEPGPAFGDGLRGIGADDALIVFSFAPHAAELVRAVRFARRRNAVVVALTDGPAAEFAAPGAAVLSLATDMAGIAPSVVPAIALAQVLADQMLALGGQAALDAVAETEAQRAALTVA